MTVFVFRPSWQLTIASHHIGRAIDSILTQTQAPAEIIVIDDGYTDGMADFLRARCEDRLVVVSQANGGVSSARRRRIELARGD